MTGALGSYRGISKLSFISKVLDKVMYNIVSLILFLTVYNLIQRQRLWGSLMTYCWLQIGVILSNLLLDLSAAFDTADHYISLHHLEWCLGWHQILTFQSEPFLVIWVTYIVLFIHVYLAILSRIMMHHHTFMLMTINCKYFQNPPVWTVLLFLILNLGCHKKKSLTLCWWIWSYSVWFP